MSKNKGKSVKIAIPTQLYESIKDNVGNIIQRGLLTLKIQCLEEEIRSLERRIEYLKRRVRELPGDIKREEELLNELIEDQKKLEILLYGKRVTNHG
jgi:predicted HTH domain antitoxin